MQALADLFALQRIHEEALFRNDDYISPEKSKAIARLIEDLCLEVRSRLHHPPGDHVLHCGACRVGAGSRS